MGNTYISHSGNPEIWGEKPDGYYTPEEWERTHRPVPPPEPTLEEARAAKLAEILAGANAMSAAVKARYSQPEIDSWQRQEAEARAILASANASTGAADPDAPAPRQAPLVCKLAANVGADPLEFARRIVGNAEAAAVATEAIILQQQAMEKAVNSAESIEAVRAVSVDYHLG